LKGSKLTETRFSTINNHQYTLMYEVFPFIFITFLEKVIA